MFPTDEKRRRFQLLEELQKEISQEKMLKYLNASVEVLVEGKQKDRWRGRNPAKQTRLLPDPRDLRGQTGSSAHQARRAMEHVRRGSLTPLIKAAAARQTEGIPLHRSFITLHKIRPL